MRAFVVCVLAALVLTGCTSRTGENPEPSSDPVELAVPIEMRPVLETESTDPTTIVLPADDGERLTLTEPILTIRRLDKAEVKLEETVGTWVLNIELDDEDTKTFADWTTDHTGERLAMVANQEVLMAPQIQGAIVNGEVQITAQYTRDEAEALLDKITGR